MRRGILAAIARQISGSEPLVEQQDGAAQRHRVVLVNRGGAELRVGVDQAIFDAAEAAGIPLPIACRYGGCITCAARLLAGSVRQPKGTALNRRQSQAGYILLCVARPKTPCVIEVGVESHGELYENPFRRSPAT